MMEPDLSFTLLRSTRSSPASHSEADLRSLAAFVFRAEKARGPVELTLDLTGPARIQGLNRHFRGVDRATDVIAFRDGPALVQGPAWLGDVAINVAQARRQAREQGHPLRREIRLLWIHGLLHLLGYTDYQPAPRRKMFKRQNALLRRWEKRN